MASQDEQHRAENDAPVTLDQELVILTAQNSPNSRFATYYASALQTRKHRNSDSDLNAAEDEMVARFTKVRQTSAEVLKEVQQTLARDDDSAEHAKNKYNQVMELLDLGHEQCNIVMNLKTKQRARGDISNEQYREDFSRLTEMRKYFLARQIHLDNQKNDLTDLIQDLSIVPKRYHHTMAEMLITGFFKQHHGILHKKMLKLEARDGAGKKTSWRRYLVDEYSGFHKRSASSEAHELMWTDKNGFGANDLIWDPIVGAYIPQSRMTGAHIVPRSIRDSYVKKLFNIPDHESFLMDAGNGLLMCQSLEKAFDLGYFIIVQLQTVDEVGKFELQCRVIHHEYLPAEGGTSTVFYSDINGTNALYWHDIHKKILRFPAGCMQRPQRRCLFYHAMGAVLMRRQLRKMGWEEVWTDFIAGDMFATPGKYLNGSFLQESWQLFTAEELPQELLKFTIEDKETQTISTDHRMHVMDMSDRFTKTVAEDDDSIASESEDEHDFE